MSGATVSTNDDQAIVARLDTEYQAAVKANDAATMDRILADDFILVTGRGTTFTKADLLEEARDRKMVYERQEELQQTVRVWGDTAVVTALLWAKGTSEGKPFDYKLWFSDTYVRTAAGWRHRGGRASSRQCGTMATRSGPKTHWTAARRSTPRKSPRVASTRCSRISRGTGSFRTRDCHRATSGPTRASRACWFVPLARNSACSHGTNGPSRRATPSQRVPVSRRFRVGRACRC